MTTKSSGCIIYYDQDGGPVTRTVTAADVEALEAAATDFSQITRLEVIDGNGRAYVAWDVTVTPSVQDDGRTLKLFVEGDRILALDSELTALRAAYEVACEIFRKQAITLPRLRDAWNTAVQRLEAANDDSR